MRKLHFNSDYQKLVHPLILQRMAQMQEQFFTGYGLDELCQSAREKIRAACGCPEAEVEFLIGGTQTNATMLDTQLASYEGILAAETAHIAVHEAGAVEGRGHKILSLPAHEGKLVAEEVDHYIREFLADDSHFHMVPPGVVYITHPTEWGTLYTLQELEALHHVCQHHKIPLYLDGARLGYGLAATGTDVTLKDVARLCDVFYIGGTKIGAMIGEAVVAPKPILFKNSLTQIKNHGALLAKGWLLGLQFDTLFTDDLYMKISRHAILMAEKLRDGLLAKGYEFLCPSPTNLQFIVVSKAERDRIEQVAEVMRDHRLPDGRQVLRLATAWYTRPEEIDRFLALL